MSWEQIKYASKGTGKIMVVMKFFNVTILSLFRNFDPFIYSTTKHIFLKLGYYKSNSEIMITNAKRIMKFFSYTASLKFQKASNIYYVTKFEKI